MWELGKDAADAARMEANSAGPHAVGQCARIPSEESAVGVQDAPPDFSRRQNVQDLLGFRQDDTPASRRIRQRRSRAGKANESNSVCE